jgi:hypothetical protein
VRWIILKQFAISNHDLINPKFKSVYCDSVSLEHFQNEKGFNMFIKTHPSCYYSFKEINPNGNVSAYFNMYSRRYRDGGRETERLGYNADVEDDIKLEKYYKNRSRERELTEELNLIHEYNQKFE